MRRHSRGYQKFIRFLILCYVFFKVLRKRLIDFLVKCYVFFKTLRRKFIGVLARCYAFSKKIRRKLIGVLAICCAFFKVIRSKAKYRKIMRASFAGIVLVIVVCVGIVYLEKSVFSTEAHYESLRENFSVEAKTDENTKNDDRTKEEMEEDSRWSEAVWRMEQDADDALWYGKINVDIAGLKEINSDIIGWIYFEAADISYPVLYCGDNETYLRAAYDGTYATAGSIFMEEQNNKNFSDKHTLIYGHNMRDQTMFGQLKLYETEKSYYENHQYFQVIYLDAETGDLVKERYHIFSCKEVTVTDDIYQVFSSDYVGLSDFSNIIRMGNYLSDANDIIVNDDDKIITLSTCTSGTSTGDERLVVSAVKCGECVVH